MREIKFRGKAKLDGKWWFGNLVPKDTRGRTQINNPEHGGCFDIDPNTIGQFTGLYDKSAKEIYEGDIVYSGFEDGSNGISLVGWNEKQSCFGVMDEYAYRSKLEGFEYPEFQNHVMLAFMRDAKVFEVIGNIHDNPKLIK